MSNTPNISRDSFDFSKFFEKTVLQQGVPVLDSDWNEQADITAMQQMATLRATLGDCVMPVPGAQTGFVCEGLPGTITDFKVTAGYACVGGALVPSTRTVVPQDFTYESDDNHMTEGKVTGVSAGEITDSNKKFSASLPWSQCRVKMTSGARVGDLLTISARKNDTTFEVDDSTGILPGDTYIVKPLALPPVALSQAYAINLWVWWESVNENQDPDIVNPGVGIETCERLVRRWCVLLGPSIDPPAYSPWEFSPRAVTIGYLIVAPGDTTLSPKSILSLRVAPRVSTDKAMGEAVVIEIAPDQSMGTVTIALPLAYPAEGPMGVRPASYYLGRDSDTAKMLSSFGLFRDRAGKRLVEPTDGREIVVYSVKVAGNIVTDPATVTDSDGFTTPGEEVILTVTTSDGTTAASIGYDPVTVLCVWKKPLWALKSGQAANEIAFNKGIHSNRVQTATASYTDPGTGAVTAIPNGTLQEALVAVSGLISNTVSKDALYAAPFNVWRKVMSRVGDGDTGAGLVSEYVRSGERIRISGGYISEGTPSDFLRAYGGTCAMEGILRPSGGAPVYVRATANLVMGMETTISLYDHTGGWETYEKADASEVKLLAGRYAGDFQVLNEMEMAAGSLVKSKHKPTVNSRTLMFENTEVLPIRIYLHKAASDYTAFEIVQNAFWNSSSQWEKNAPALKASLVQFSNGGISVKEEANPSNQTFLDSDWRSSTQLSAGGLLTTRGAAIAKATYCLSFHNPKVDAATNVMTYDCADFGREMHQATSFGSSLTFASEASSGWGVGTVTVDPGILLNARRVAIHGMVPTVPAGMAIYNMGYVQLSMVP